MVWYHWDEVKEKKMKAKTSWYHLHCKKKTPSPKNEVIKINAMHKTTCTIEYRQLVLNWRNKRFAINHRVWFWWKTVSIEFFLKHPERVLFYIFHIKAPSLSFWCLKKSTIYYSWLGQRKHPKFAVDGKRPGVPGSVCVAWSWEKEREKKKANIKEWWCRNELFS